MRIEDRTTGESDAPWEARLLESLTLGFVVRVQGDWGDQAIEAFRAGLEERHHLRPSERELEGALQCARQRYGEGDAHLFLCSGQPCAVRRRFAAAPGSDDRTSPSDAPLLTETECQGPCRQAPVATLRLGKRVEMFSQFTHQEDWERVVRFADRAAEARTLLISPGEEQIYRFDPTHESPAMNLPLRRLEFLLGDFEGSCIYEGGDQTFHKEAIGSWEVGGRYIGIRMAVTYPIPDGRKDTHTAFAMIGTNRSTRQLECQVYTDGDEIHPFALTLEDSDLILQERVDRQHGVSASRARKIFSPTEDGYEERLELDYGKGTFELYYRIAMRRVHQPHG